MNDSNDYDNSVANWALILCGVLAAALFAISVMTYRYHVKQTQAFSDLEQRVQALEKAK